MILVLQRISTLDTAIVGTSESRTRRSALAMEASVLTRSKAICSSSDRVTTTRGGLMPALASLCAATSGEYDGTLTFATKDAMDR